LKAAYVGGAMLTACRLAGLSALDAHYGGTAHAQMGSGSTRWRLRGRGGGGSWATGAEPLGAQKQANGRLEQYWTTVLG
jgi:hypothetical protein